MYGLKCLRENSVRVFFRRCSCFEFLPADVGGLVSGCTQSMQPCDVEGQCGQGEFVVYVLQSTGAKLSHSTLLFEHSEDRFDDRLAPRVGGLAGRTSQLGP